jgi:hypothetical protein
MTDDQTAEAITAGIRQSMPYPSQTFAAIAEGVRLALIGRHPDLSDVVYRAVYNATRDHYRTTTTNRPEEVTE